jgi:lipoprotein signal peptidase
LEEAALTDQTFVEHLRMPAVVLLVASVLVADQVTKAAAAARGVVAANPSYALGLFGGPAAILIAVALLVLVAFLALVTYTARTLGVSPIITALITGGMLSNVLDRIRFGAARDFVTTPWVIVNLADIAVAVGLVGFVVTALWRVYNMRAHAMARVPRSS